MRLPERARWILETLGRPVSTLLHMCQCPALLLSFLYLLLSSPAVHLPPGQQEPTRVQPRRSPILPHRCHKVGISAYLSVDA